MSGAHTTGPWSITSVSMNTGAIGIAKDRILIAEAHNGHSFMDVVQGNYPTEQWANANLIAAAPDMLDALEAYAAAYDDATGTVYVNDQIRAAIAKARGESL